MDVNMTSLSERPMPDPMPEPETPRVFYQEQQRGFGSPVQEVPYQRPWIEEPTEEKKEELHLDRQTIILCFAAFLIGLLLGTLKRPIILKSG